MVPLYQTGNHTMKSQLVRTICLATIIGAVFGTPAWRQSPDSNGQDKAERRPNILFCIADDWGWPHAGALGDSVVQTPAFDRLAREGVLFPHAYVASPSCTPSRNAILTGQWHWRLKEGANLHSSLSPDLKVYPKLLGAAGYHVGHWRKSWGPGRLKGWNGHPVGLGYEKGFKEFLEARPEDAPFCFWLGAYDPHRPYRRGTGAASGLDCDEIDLFPFFPDCEEVRGDVADYYFEVGRFDQDVASAIALLEEAGELDNTLIVMTGDHGMPFPRCKGNVYDSGARVPLAIRWGDRVKGGQVLDDFVSMTDLAPSFLSAAGLEIPSSMTGQDLLPRLEGGEDVVRSFVLIGRERHTPAQEQPLSGGYPVRALRNEEFLYVRNYEPDRWPAGTPHHERAYMKNAWLGDCDNGPTKLVIVARAPTDPIYAESYRLCFAKRPGEELYDLKSDPHQLVNLAANPEYTQVKAELAAQLVAELKASGDPRVIGGAKAFDDYPYFGGVPKYPGADAIEAYR